eukprot:Seg4173.2 transcript_id=Seg4173.2/GoldUCD/mRNA.D3Y31 product="Histamine N-methyltransferase" protein_id=Seg4173.2/GoldUCD/D3Y31
MEDFVADNNKYTDTYDVYRRGLLEQQRAWVNKQVIPVLSRILGQSCLRILSIGSGEGDVDIMLLEALLQECARKGQENCKIDYVVVERNAMFISRFKERVALKTEVFPNVNFSFIEGTFEDVTTSNSSSSHNGLDMGNIDFILITHVLYYMNEEKVLQECMANHLKTGGILMAVVQSEASIYAKTCRKYDKKLTNCFEGFNVLCETDMGAIAKKNQWKHQIEIGKRVLDVTDIVASDRPNPVGIKLLDFFFHAKNLLSLVSEEQLQEILEFFKANTEVIDGKYIAVGNESIVFLFK